MYFRILLAVFVGTFAAIGFWYTVIRYGFGYAARYIPNHSDLVTNLFLLSLFATWIGFMFAAYKLCPGKR